MAKKRRKARRSSIPRRHAVARVHHRRKHNRRRRNPMVKVYNRHHRRHNRRHHRRNPMGFASKQYLEIVGGSLIGLAAARSIPAMIPTTVTGALPSTPFTGAFVTGAATFLAWWAGKNFLPKDVAAGIAVGGGIVAASQLWSALGLPTAYGLGVSGMGDIVATQGFAVPDRDMRAPVPITAGTSGVGAYGTGMYRRMAR